MMKKLFLLTASIVFSQIVYTQSAIRGPEGCRLPIKETTAAITVDGELTEPVWQSLAVADNFWQQAPVDGVRANQRTQVRMTYNKKFVYLAATCWDAPDYVIQTLKRDNYGQSDEFAVVFDPVDQQTNGYTFSVNARGAQTEALIAPTGGGSAIDDSWDNRWFVAVQNYADRWTVEMAIPFKTLRFKTDLSNWGINFVRLEPGSNETDVWSPVPRQFDAFDLGYLGDLQWDQAPSNTGKNIALIPYARVAHNQSFSPEAPSDTKPAVGADAKIALSPTLNLDLTYNPDFSQVEVDDQVTNLTRFNIFFPEKRQFFLENGDVFNQFGQFADRPFYSRRIGLDAAGGPVPILYGLRLSGNLNPRFRLGVINMHTEGNDTRLGQNYSALTFQQRLWQRSSLKGIFLNRQGFDGSKSEKSDYGRNLGGEFNYSTPDGKSKWPFWVFTFL